MQLACESVLPSPSQIPSPPGHVCPRVYAIQRWDFYCSRWDFLFSRWDFNWLRLGQFFLRFFTMGFLPAGNDSILLEFNMGTQGSEIVPRLAHKR